jgi:hypothetical protein
MICLPCSLELHMLTCRFGDRKEFPVKVRSGTDRVATAIYTEGKGFTGVGEDTSGSWGHTTGGCTFPEGQDGESSAECCITQTLHCVYTCDVLVLTQPHHR